MASGHGMMSVDKNLLIQNYSNGYFNPIYLLILLDNVL